MRKMFTLEMKDYLMRMVLFVAVCMVGVGGLKAAPGLSADDPLIFEGGEEYDVSGSYFKDLYATFTAPSDGVLTLTFDSTDPLDLYTDNTYQTMVEPRLVYNNGVCELEVKAGITYYFHRSFMLSARTISVEFGKEAVALKLQRVSPTEGETLFVSNATVSFTFNRDVKMDGATLTIGGKEKSIDAVSTSSSVQFDLSAIMMEAYNDGILKEGDDMLLTLKGVRNANKESDIYGEDGTCSLTLKAAAKPVVLNSSVNTPGNGMDIFHSYIMSGDENVVQLNFDGALDTEKKPVATLIYGDIEAENGFYQETLDAQFLGENTVTVDLSGKSRRHKDMLPNYSGAAFGTISLKIAGVYAADGQPVYSGAQSSVGSCTFQYAYEEVKVDIAVAFDDLAESNSIDGLDSLTIWVRGDEYLHYTGVQFDFMVNGQVNSIVEKDIKKKADSEEEGACILRVCVPKSDADANSEVKVSFVGLEAADGGDYSADFSAVFTTVGNLVNVPDLILTPVSGSTVENIKEVLVGCSEGICVNADNKEKIQIWDRMRNVVATAVSMEPVIPEDEKENPDYIPTEIKVVFDNEVKLPGAYMVNLPAEAFVLGNQTSILSKATLVDYMIIGEVAKDYVPSEVVAETEGSTVIGFTIKTSEWVTLDENFDTEKIKIYNSNTQEEVVGGKSVSYAAAFEDFSIALENPLTEKGTYTLFIPAELFGNGSWIPGSTEGSCNPELTYTIVIDENGVTVGVNSVLAEIGTKVTVYNLNGVRVLYNADRDALKALRKGIYVVNGKKVVIK